MKKYGGLNIDSANRARTWSHVIPKPARTWSHMILLWCAPIVLGGWGGRVMKTASLRPPHPNRSSAWGVRGNEDFQPHLGGPQAQVHTLGRRTHTLRPQGR